MIYLALSCRALLGTVFLVSGLSKVSGRASFLAYSRSVRRLGSLRRNWVLPASWALITAEFAVVGLLAIPYGRAAVDGFAVACGLLILFSIAIIRSLGRGERAPCRCFGATTAPLGWRHVLRNSILAGVALAGLFSPYSLSNARVAGLAVSVAIGLVRGWLMTELDQITELFVPSELSAARRTS